MEIDYVRDLEDVLGAFFAYHSHTMWRIREKKPKIYPGYIIRCISVNEVYFRETFLWINFPAEARPNILTIIKEHHNLFTTKGLAKPIRGFEFPVEKRT